MNSTPHTLAVVCESEDLFPNRAHPTDAGLDLKSAIDIVLEPLQRAIVPTGVKIALEENTVGLVCPRSGLAVKHGISVVNGPGVVDAGYRGELKVVLINTDPEHPCTISRGDRIAQLVITPILIPELVQVSDLDEADRGDRGFGSTGTLDAHNTKEK